MEWISNNYALIIVILIIAAYILLNGTQSINNWLLFFVSCAEADLGSGTGKLKLAQVYSDFVAAYPIFSKILPFFVFSWMVDNVLEKMRDMANKNENISALIYGVEKTEKD